ncbi:MAG TPA: hypothetical protein VLH84_03605 [Patescibacteria group bacterium]|nr:hypothetical protein [Patescibacteria group bacterium]
MKKYTFRARGKLAIGTAIVVVLGLSAFAFLRIAGGTNSRLTDEEIAQDLSIIEKAVWDDFGRKRLLPEKLDTVAVHGLNGELRDYTYHLVQQYEGGPNESFALCSDFHSNTRKPADADYGYYMSPDGFTHHTKGKQCFSIFWDINGGSSSISLIDDVPDWAKR